MANGTEIRPFRVDTLAFDGTCRRSIAGRAAGDDRALARYWIAPIFKSARADGLVITPELRSLRTRITIDVIWPRSGGIPGATSPGTLVGSGL